MLPVHAGHSIGQDQYASISEWRAFLHSTAITGLTTLVKQLDDKSMSEEVVTEPDLLPALMLGLSAGYEQATTSGNASGSGALALFVELMGKPMFVRLCMQGAGVFTILDQRI